MGTAARQQSEAYRVEVLDEVELAHGGWYDAWTCAGCGFALTCETFRHTDTHTSIKQLSPADVRVRIVCPSCSTEQCHGINDRRVRYVEPSR